MGPNGGGSTCGAGSAAGNDPGLALGENGADGWAWAGSLRTLLIILWRFIKALPLVLVFPNLLGIEMAALALVDLASVFRKKSLPPNERPNNASASVVIPNWNGRDLL